MQNATEILTLKCSTQKNKAETTLQNHEKTPKFEEDALENDAVGDDLEVHHDAKEAKPSTLTYVHENLSKGSNNYGYPNEQC